MGRGAPRVSLLLFALLSASLLAQAPPDAPNFRAGTALVEVTVVVTGVDGRHVADLRQQDVSIVEGGRPREIAFLQIPAEDLSCRPLNGMTACTLEIAIAERTPEGLVGIRHEVGSFAVTAEQAQDLTAVTVRFPKQWTIDAKTSLIRVVIRDRYTGRYGTLDVPVSALR